MSNRVAKPPSKKGTKGGRPKVWDEKKVMDEICGILATTSRSLRDICSDPSLDLPDVMTVIRWINRNQGHAKMYAAAREAQADVIFDEIIEIADGKRPVGEEKDIIEVLIDDGMKEAEARAFVTKLQPHVVQRDRLRVNARMYAASKLRPGTYGDKVDAAGGSGLRMKIEINIE